jgi:hypothetical protein
MIDFRLSWLDGILGCLRKLVGFAAAGESKIGIQETPKGTVSCPFFFVRCQSSYGKSRIPADQSLKFPKVLQIGITAAIHRSRTKDLIHTSCSFGR